MPFSSHHNTLDSYSFQNSCLFLRFYLERRVIRLFYAQNFDFLTVLRDTLPIFAPSSSVNKIPLLDIPSKQKFITAKNTTEEAIVWLLEKRPSYLLLVLVKRFSYHGQLHPRGWSR